MVVYAFTIFLSAILVFQVQPIIAKAILPWFGGGAAVWTACMLFFQMLLLLGYGYAHWLRTLTRTKWQIVIHSSLVAVSIALLPIVPDPQWRSAAENPILNILAVLMTSVGLPYFVLSTTTPLVQSWFANTHRTALPYRLFSVSNAASLLGLVAYPFALEPFISTNQQLTFWSIGYAIFGVLCILTAIKTGRSARFAGEAEVRIETPIAKPLQLGDYALWVCLAACASALLLSFTNFLSQDVAPVPFLWILPLACYLLSFILCFGSDSLYHPKVFRTSLVPAFLTLGVLMVFRLAGAGMLVVVALVTLLLACTFCHGELARLKPAATQLTSFYLALALGGALGGLFVAVLAPVMYTTYVELPVSAVGCILMAAALAYGGTAAHANLAAAATVIMALMFAYMPNVVTGNVLTARNFYGALRVTDGNSKSGRVRQLYHGSTIHGAAFLTPEDRLKPTTYYGSNSAIGMLLGNRSDFPRKVGVVGLGAGTLATYAAEGDTFRFYEINPLVQQIAETRFDFLRGCQGHCEVVVGDARLSLEREENHNFDILALDAFSGDSVPVHLLTTEAFRTYFRHLKPSGVLAVHISNRYLELAPIVASACEPLGKVVRVLDSSSFDDKLQTYGNSWVIVTNDATLFAQASLSAATRASRHVRPWTDDYSNLFQILRF